MVLSLSFSPSVLATMAESLAKLLESQAILDKQLLESQDIIAKQLTHHFEYTDPLLNRTPPPPPQPQAPPQPQPPRAPQRPHAIDIQPLSEKYIDNLTVLNPEAILYNRIINNEEQILVKWHDRDIPESTWVLAADIATVHENSDLEDKVHVEQGGIDTGHDPPYDPDPGGNPHDRIRRRPARYLE